jgi:heme-degrading monooxygenase HmoA
MIYTSGDWLVKPGREEEFIEAWHELAEWTAAEIAPGARAMLLHDRDEPALFRSLGPWDSDPQVAAWRQSEGFAARIGRIRELLDRFEAHTLDVVADRRRRAAMRRTWFDGTALV